MAQKGGSFGTGGGEGEGDGESESVQAVKKQYSMKRGYNFPIKVRAHSNPLSDETYYVPARPSLFPFSSYYPQLSAALASSAEEEAMRPDGYPQEKVTMCDVGCAWGGMLVRLAPLFPDEVFLGIEIRDRVAEFAKGRMEDLREKNPLRYTNVSVVRSNGMRFLPNYFEKGQLNGIFFIHPDPHFKKSNHRRRIITPELLAEYAHVLRLGAKLYAVTDVKELWDWMRSAVDAHPLFRKVVAYDDFEEELTARNKEGAFMVPQQVTDPYIRHILHSSEDGAKVKKSKNLSTHWGIWERVPDAVELLPVDQLHTLPHQIAW
eukprot:ANDGO_03423.mRNA.1 tRNA (guanine-N(7)-)-methyltransferase